MKRITLKILHWNCRIFLAGIFIYAGYTKIVNPLQFAAAVEGYQLLSPDSVILVARILPWVEVILGIALIAGLMIRYTAAFAVAFLTFFIGIMLATYLRGIEADCGCFGIGERISPFTLARDSLFILPALFLVFQPWLESRKWLRGPGR
ncbi:MAG: DoxX family membrane protein [Deltaproteobacteria bacterium]|nr:DoxX family membrane protein [Deltaproteobacteria bacterium]